MKTQTNVPLPDTYQRDDMLLAELGKLRKSKVGTSILFDSTRGHHHVQKCAHNYAKRHGISFKTRKDKETGMMRIWRA